MTNKEATKFGIETLEYMRDNYPYLDDERKQALNFVIKALEESPHGDLINREALKKAFEDTVCIEPMPYAFVKQIIDNAPPIEYTFEEAFQKTVCENKLYCPARPHGEWGDPFFWNGKTYHKCTNCCISTELTLIDKYCPNCGAKMEYIGGRQ